MRIGLCVAMMAAVIALGSVADPAFAQSWPTKPISIVVPFPPGAADTNVRIMQPIIEKELGQPLIIENKTGASGLLGAATVAKSAPDGYTFLYTTTSSVVMGPLVIPDPGFDPNKDLIPVAYGIVATMFFAIRAEVPVNNWREFVAYAKANPDKLNFGTPGVGSVFHLEMEAINRLAGIRLNHVPYRGFVPMVQALQGGELQAVIGPLSMMQKDIDAGKLKVIAIEKDIGLPGLPKVADLSKDVAGFETPLSPTLFMAPAGTPVAILDRLNAAVVKAMNAPDVKAKLDLPGQALVPMSRADTVAAYADVTRISAKLVADAKASGVKLTD